MDGCAGHTVWQDPRLPDCLFPVPTQYDKALYGVHALLDRSGEQGCDARIEADAGASTSSPGFTPTKTRHLCDPAGSRSPPNGGRAGIPSSRSVPVYHMDSLRTVEQRPEGGSRRAAREGAADSPLRPDSLTQPVHSTVQSESPSLRRRVTFLSQVSSHFFHPADRLPPHNSSSEMASVPPEVSTQGPSKALQRFKVGTPSSLGAHQLGATPAFPAHPEPHSYPAVKAPPGSNAPAAAL